MEAIKVEVYLPGVTDGSPESEVQVPVSLDDYVGMTAMLAQSGMGTDLSLLPDFFYYDNPMSGVRCSIEPDPVETNAP